MRATAVQIPTYDGAVFGTLTTPDACDLSTAVLLLADAGATDRNGNSDDGFNTSDCLKHLAHNLAAEGVSSLRYDKRGTGLSALPNLSTSDLRIEDYAQDALHAAQFLRQTLGYQRVVMLGHGEGGLVGLLAARSAGIDGLITIGVSAQHPADLLTAQLQQQLSSELFSEASAIVQQLRDGYFVDAVPDTFDALFDLQLQPFLMSLFRYEPTQLMAELGAPALVIHGGQDVQVTPADAKVLAASGRQAQDVMLSRMNHVFKDVAPGISNQLALYHDPDVAINATLASQVAQFVATTEFANPPSDTLALDTL